VAIEELDATDCSRPRRRTLDLASGGFAHPSTSALAVIAVGDRDGVTSMARVRAGRCRASGSASTAGSGSDPDDRTAGTRQRLMKAAPS